MAFFSIRTASLKGKSQLSHGAVCDDRSGFIFGLLLCPGPGQRLSSASFAAAVSDCDVVENQSQPGFERHHWFLLIVPGTKRNWGLCDFVLAVPRSVCLFNGRLCP